jgi:ribosomal protein S18 acetylase RimI-like enzyme
MPETLDIRMAVPAEVDRLAELARRTFVATFAEHNTPEDMALYVDKAFNRDQLLSELEDSASTFIWAERTGIPIGYAKLRRGTERKCVTGPKPVELERMYAESDQIGVGVGKTLLHMAIKICQSEGFQTMWLGVWESNDRAIEFYRRQGFFAVGEQEFMLGADRQTDLIMQLDMRC